MGGIAAKFKPVHFFSPDNPLLTIFLLRPHGFLPPSNIAFNRA